MTAGKKLLIVNQHSQNHGDEAAGLALIRSLHRAGFTDLTVLYNMHVTDPACFLRCDGVKQVVPDGYVRGMSRLARLYLNYPCPLTRLLPFGFHRYRADYRALAAADWVINAPGGVNLGIYRDYVYLWRLEMARQLGKPLAIYSPSIGPLPPGDRFTERARRVLAAAKFLSLRDAQSCRYAEELGLPFRRSIDTAFLETPEPELPLELRQLLPASYVVLVPNQLYLWHHRFGGELREAFDRFYERLIRRFVAEGLSVVLLPQLFCQGSWNDEDYFRRLAGELPGVVVVPTEYGSDLQQRVIAGAEFTAGARYHTIVFSINNLTPFFCLSYEHKMRSMLELLALDDAAVEVTAALAAPEETVAAVYRSFGERAQLRSRLPEARERARELARGTFAALLERLAADE